MLFSLYVYTSTSEIQNLSLEWHRCASHSPLLAALVDVCARRSVSMTDLQHWWLLKEKAGMSWFPLHRVQSKIWKQQLNHLFRILYQYQGTCMCNFA